MPTLYEIVGDQATHSIFRGFTIMPEKYRNKFPKEGILCVSHIPLFDGVFKLEQEGDWLTVKQQ